MAATQGYEQLIRSILDFIILPKDSSQHENQGNQTSEPSDNKKLVLPLIHSRLNNSISPIKTDWKT